MAAAAPKARSSVPSSPAMASASSPSGVTGTALPSTTEALLEQPSVQLRYSIAGASSYTGTYEPHNILYDRPLDIKSRWTAAYVSSAPDASQLSASAANAAGAGNADAQNQPGAQSQSTGGTSQTGAQGTSTSGNFLASYASAVPTTGARPRSPLPQSRRGAGVQPPQSSGGSAQYLVLKLEKPSIVRRIHFGKFHRAHACNLKDLIVYASPTARDANSRAWIPILRCGLKNDQLAESFKTQYATADGVPFPTRYLKIVPLATHQPNYNYSVWYVALEGVSDQDVLRRIAVEYQDHRESITLRMILKYLRSRAYHSAFRILLESSQLDAPLDYGAARNATPASTKRPFEHPIVTRLFHSLMQGQWDVAEACLEQAASGESTPVPSSPPSMADSAEALGAPKAPDASANVAAASSLLSSYVDRSIPNPVWSPIVATDDDGEMPCGRAGHQMELDADKGILWLFGGWDGSRDLNDLWAYHIREGRWRCLSTDTRRQGGPGPRSCHAMVFDPRTSFLYVLGRFVDTEKPQSQQRSSSTPSSGPAPSRDAQQGSASRGLLVPRFPGAAAVDGSSAPQPRENQDELFSSGRGGSMRLNQGGRQDAPREGTTSAPRNAPAADASTSPSRTGAGTSPRPAGSSRHPWRFTQTGYESDFYRFSTRSERWDRLSADTCAEGGPKLLGDTQMVIDSDTQLLYVFGGHEYTNDVTLPTLSGMWKYDVIQRSWTFLFDDSSDPESRIPARAGHIMLLDAPRRGSMAGKRVLWIMAGKRGPNYLADMWTYHTHTGVVRQVCQDYHLLGGPEGGFTQRATIDSDAREITLFSGLVHSKNRSDTEARSAFWTYHIDRNEWRLVYEAGGAGSAQRRGESGSDDGGHGSVVADQGEDSDMAVDPGEPSAFPVLQTPQDDLEAGMSAEVLHAGGQVAFGATDLEPRPRYATQMVYDHIGKLYYIFGGNPMGAGPSTRLGDLWSLELLRPSLAEVLRRAKFRLRQQRFLEMTAETNPMEALMYLQARVSEVVNHDVPEESQAFRKLMAHLLHSSPTSGSAFGADMGSYVAPDAPAMPGMDPLGRSDPLVRVSDATEEGADSPAWPGAPSVSSPLAEKTAHSGSSGSEGENAEMLSVSQFLSPTVGAGAAQFGAPLAGSGAHHLDSMASEGRPTVLYHQRYRLFRALCEFLPAEDTEPESDLLDCIDASKISFPSLHPL